MKLARESSGKGSRYGQVTLGKLHNFDWDYAQALPFYRLAAAQGLDGAQCELGLMYGNGSGVIDEDYAETLRWFQLAAAQGHPDALYMVARCHNFGDGVPKNKAAAIRWYRRAAAAGKTEAADALQQLGA